MTHEMSIRYDTAHFPPRVFVSCKCGWEEYAGTSTREANRKFTTHAALDNARQETARRCAEIAMEICRSLNEKAGVLNRIGQYERAQLKQLRADQCEEVAEAIHREFGLDAEGGR